MPCRDQLLLEVIDLTIAAAVLVFGRESFDALDQHATVPAAIEDRDAAGAGEMPPEPPQVVPRLLFVGRRTDRNHLIVAGIESAGDAPDGAALAGGVPALEHENRGDAFRLCLPLQQIETALLALEGFVEALRVEPLVSCPA